LGRLRLQDQDQPGLHSENLTQKTKKKKEFSVFFHIMVLHIVKGNSGVESSCP
jgi:hypothetical protein